MGTLELMGTVPEFQWEPFNGKFPTFFGTFPNLNERHDYKQPCLPHNACPTGFDSFSIVLLYNHPNPKGLSVSSSECPHQPVARKLPVEDTRIISESSPGPYRSQLLQTLGPVLITENLMAGGFLESSACSPDN